MRYWSLVAESQGEVKRSCLQRASAMIVSHRVWIIQVMEGEGKWDWVNI